MERYGGMAGVFKNDKGIMKKIIIFYEPTSQKHLINSIIKYCSTKKLLIDAFCLGDFTYNGSINKNSYFDKFVCKYYKKRYIGYIVRLLFFTRLLINKSQEYDYIDISFFTPIYYKFLDYLIRINKPYKLTIWGSDFYRASKDELQRKRYYLEKANKIQVETDIVKQDFVRCFPSVRNKIYVCNYGIELFDNIDKLRERSTNLLGINTYNKIVVTCGYNGSKGQQHLEIIKAISLLASEVRDKLFLLFPMTYGISDRNYINEIKTQLDELNISYNIFINKLNEDELAELRLRSNIVINVQITDAFSSSLIEHIYAGSILISGNWLPYSILTDAGIRYIPTSLELLNEMILLTLTNLEYEQERCSDNIKNAYNLSSWSNVSSKLSNIFQDI